VLSLTCYQIVLETEVTNKASLKLYESLGFLRSKRLHRYYLNGNTAFRLCLYLKAGTGTKVPTGAEYVPPHDYDDEESQLSPIPFVGE